MPKICFQVIAWNASPFLEPCLASIAPFGDIVAAEGPVTFWRERGFTTSTDDTKEVLAKYTARLVCAAWSEKDEMVNAAARMIPDDCTHVFAVDSDEIWRAQDIEAIIPELDNWDSVAFKPQTFFGGLDRVLTGFELSAMWYRIQRFYPGCRWHTHRPPTILAPDGRPWRDHRHWDAPYAFAHYSYVFPKAVKAKIEYYAAYFGGTIPDYRERVWLPWARGDAAERQRIEDEFDGVHEYLPSRRGQCRTTPFTGRHPEVIEKRLPELRARFERELEEYI